MKFQRGISTLIGLIIVIAVVVLATGGFFAYQRFFINKGTEKNNQQTILRDEISNWKTYTNTKLGYEIKYPNDWEYREYPSTQSGAGFRPANKPNDVQYEFINIDAKGTAESQYDIPFDEYVKTAAVQEIQNFEKLNSIEQVSANSGIKGYKTTWVYTSMTDNEKKISFPITYFDFHRTIDFYKYKAIQVSLGSKDYEEIYGKILYTFKLINPQSGIIYKNSQYGFELVLSDSWKGYSIINNTWNGFLANDSSKKFQGPEIIIRNPNWTEGQPWQDIPVMVFTKDEWQQVQAENLNVSAAPIGPSKLGENQNYVFALPPRWIGFTDALGQDEAVNITKTFKGITN